MDRACSRTEAEEARRARLELDHQRLDLPQAPRVAGQAAPAEVQQRLGAEQARLPLRARRARVSAPCASPCMRPASTGLCGRQRTGVSQARPSCELRSCCACRAGHGGQRLPRRRRLLRTLRAAALAPQLSEGEQGMEPAAPAPALPAAARAAAGPAAQWAASGAAAARPRARPAARAGAAPAAAPARAPRATARRRRARRGGPARDLHVPALHAIS